jgi:hypothetical protein
VRQRIVWLNGQRFEVDPDWRPPPRLFHIQGDTHEPFQSMADGKMYTSKSRYRAELKAHGYEEVACSLESRLQAKHDELARTNMPDLTIAELNARAEQIGFDWRPPEPSELSQTPQESGIGWR